MSSLLKSTRCEPGLVSRHCGGCAGPVGFVTTTSERRCAGFSASGHPLHASGGSETRQRRGLAGATLSGTAELPGRQVAAPQFDADRTQAWILLVGTRRALPSDATG